MSAGPAAAQHTICGVCWLLSAQPIQASLLPTHRRQLGRGTLAAQVRLAERSALCALCPCPLVALLGGVQHAVALKIDPPEVKAAVLTLLNGAHRSYRQSVLAVAISAVLAGTPEIVHLYNHGALHGVLGAKAGRSHQKGSTASTSSSWGGQGGGREDVGEWTVRLHVQGLRCAACGAHLKQALLAHAEGVSDCTVDFASGVVAVRGRALEERNLLDTVQRLGYSASVAEHACQNVDRLLDKEL